MEKGPTPPTSPANKPPKQKSPGKSKKDTFGSIMKLRNEGPFDPWDAKKFQPDGKKAEKKSAKTPEKKEGVLKKNGSKGMEKKIEPTIQALAEAAAKRAIEILDKDGEAAPNARAVIEKLKSDINANIKNPAKAKASLEQLAEVAAKIQATHVSKNGRSAAEVKLQIEPLRQKKDANFEQERGTETFKKFERTSAELKEFLRQAKIDAAAKGDFEKFKAHGDALDALVDKENSADESAKLHKLLAEAASQNTLRESEAITNQLKNKEVPAAPPVHKGESNPDVLEIEMSEGEKRKKEEGAEKEITEKLRAQQERKKDEEEKALNAYVDVNKEKAVQEEKILLDTYGDGVKEKTERDAQLKAGEEERKKDEALALEVYGEGDKPKAERLRREAEQKQKEEALALEVYGPGENEQTKIWTAQVERLTVLVGKYREAHEAHRHNFEERLARDAPEHANWFQRGLAKYRAFPRWQRMAFSAALVTAGAASTIAFGPGAYATWIIWSLQQGATAGATVFADSALERKKSNFLRFAGTIGAGAGAAFLIPALPEILEATPSAVSNALKSLGFDSNSFKLKLPWSVNGDETHWLNKPVANLSQIVTGDVFSNAVTVTEADRLHGLWGILENKLRDTGIIDSTITDKAKNFKLDYLKDKLAELAPDELKKIGFKSGNINIIRAGETLDLSILEKRGWLQKIR